MSRGPPLAAVGAGSPGTRLAIGALEPAVPLALSAPARRSVVTVYVADVSMSGGSSAWRSGSTGSPDAGTVEIFISASCLSTGTSSLSGLAVMSQQVSMLERDVGRSSTRRRVNSLLGPGRRSRKRCCGLLNSREMARF